MPLEGLSLEETVYTSSLAQVCSGGKHGGYLITIYKYLVLYLLEIYFLFYYNYFYLV
ncbi:hypothetical protein ABIB50_004756 [Mucilaginibacter sp. UYCu711]